MFKCTFLAFTFAIIIACNEEQKYTEEFIEVYQIDSATPKGAKGKLQFMESYVRDMQDREIAHGVYNVDTTVQAIEKFIYEEGSIRPIKSEYRDDKDTLLSYYKFHYNEDGLKSRSIAFDGNTNEVLRMENFEYDKNGNMIKKSIKNAQDSLVRIFEFKHDEFGNESLLEVRDGNENLLLTEEFVITKKRKDGLWVERYGYRDNKPKTFRKRYWKETVFSK